MLIESILKAKGRDVATLSPDETIATACGLLSSRRIGAVVIIDGQQGVQGIVSERDIVRAFAQHGDRAFVMRLADVMTRDVVSCRGDDTVQGVMAVMTNRRVRHLPVVEDGQLIGIISIGDVVKSRIQETELESQVLVDYVLAGH